MELDWEVIRKFGARIYEGNKTSVGLATLKERKLRVTMELKKVQEDVHAEAPEFTGKVSVAKPPFQGWWDKQ